MISNVKCLDQQHSTQPFWKGVTNVISHQDALIYTRFMVSAADNDITDAELSAMGRRVRYLPIFAFESMHYDYLQLVPPTV